MEKEMLRQLPNGKWEYLVDEAGEMIVLADTREEAERLAEAYRKGETSVARKRVARAAVEKPRTALVEEE